jgi:hypothetical protein
MAEPIVNELKANAAAMREAVKYLKRFKQGFMFTPVIGPLEARIAATEQCIKSQAQQGVTQ